MMQNLHFCRVILNVVRIVIARNNEIPWSRKSFRRVNRRQIMGTLMISIIFAISVEEGIKYLRQIRKEMYDLWISAFLLGIPLQFLCGLNPDRFWGNKLIKINAMLIISVRCFLCFYLKISTLSRTLFTQESEKWIKRKAQQNCKTLQHTFCWHFCWQGVLQPLRSMLASHPWKWPIRQRF